jgi:hypothetical protein
MHKIEEEEAQESKLVKVLSLLQDHFGADKQDEQSMEDFQMSFGTEIKLHKRMLRKEMKSLGGNQKVKQYISKALEKAADSFYYEITQNVHAMGSAMIEEGSGSKARMDLMTASFMQELKADVSEESREKIEESKLEHADPKWMRLAHQYREEHKNQESQDEKDEEHMLQNLEDNLENTVPVSMTAKELAEAEKIQTLNDKLMEAGNNQQERPRNEAAIMDKMLSILDQHKEHPIVKALHAGASATVDAFSKLVDAAKLEASKEPLEKELKDWEKGKLNIKEAMMAVEEEVEEDKLNPEMLHDGETAKESAEMLEMDAQVLCGTLIRHALLYLFCSWVDPPICFICSIPSPSFKTHADMDKAIEDVPLPDEAEAVADQVIEDIGDGPDPSEGENSTEDMGEDGADGARRLRGAL